MPHSGPEHYGVSSFYAHEAGSAQGPKALVAVEGRGDSSFADYVCKGDFSALQGIGDGNAASIEVLKRIFASGLGGCGGSHIPLSKKWGTAIPHQPRYLVVNGLEGEPYTFKDYFLMVHYPQVVIEGIAIACRVLGIREVFLVINSAYREGYESLQAVIGDNQPMLGDIRIHLRYGPEVDLYIVGEETALLNYLEGRRGEPRLKPPYPHEQGLWGTPTVINNVETLSWLPILLAMPGRFAQRRPKLVTLLGDVRDPGIYEVNLGDPLPKILGQAQADDLAFAEIGGISGGLLPAALTDVAYEDEALSGLGLQVGSGTIRVFDSSRDPLAEMVRSMMYFREESCGRCTPCRVGTQALAGFANQLQRGRMTAAGVNRSRDISVTMQLTSTCGLGRAAPVPLLSYLNYFVEQDGD